MRFSTVSRSASPSSTSIVSTSRSGSGAAVDVHDVLVVEAAHHVDDRVGLADVAEELVAEALALGGALHEAGDVDELDRRRDDRAQWTIASRASRRASGTMTTPVFGSIVQNG